MGNIKILLRLFKENIIKNIVILIQIIFSIYVVTILLLEIIYNLETKELLSKNNFENKIVFAEALHINNLMPSEGRNAKYAEIRKYLESLDGVKSASNVYSTQLQNQKFLTYLYDESLIKDLYFDLIYGIEHKANNPNQQNLEKNIYPIISQNYNNTIHNIKCDINRANNMMYYECDASKLQDYFSLNKDTKPKIKTVVNTIIDKIS